MVEELEFVIQDEGHFAFLLERGLCDGTLRGGSESEVLPSIDFVVEYCHSRDVFQRDLKPEISSSTRTAI
ncbi:hypothetical protein JHK84_046210 [Glycine max]|nr:hypothetical protein JHK87_045977 [Glycine soja]KAG5101241.1 hypothetical protein JHK84_046210 [Glycine max]KAH1116243.1 hypothetical protein GYH30_045931 [Glycine max]KHN03453.1 hypothetical protein glysoja_004479 [Glycine soja]